MTADNDDLINPSDFESFEIEVSLMNCTTNSEIRNDQRILIDKRGAKFSVDSPDEADFSIRVVEFLNTGIMLSVPARSCARGHKIVLHLAVSGVEVPAVFSTLATVKQIQDIDATRTQITVEFQKFDKSVWRYIKDIYNNRQNQVIDFFKAAKGS